MRKLGTAPKAKDIVAEQPPVNNWLEIVGEHIQAWRNSPVFHVYSSGAQALTSSAALLAFGVEQYDTAACFNNTGATVNGIPAYSWRPTVAGHYYVGGGFQIASTVATILTLFVFKNGIIHRIVGYTDGAGGIYGGTHVYLNGSTDYVQLYGASTAAQNTSGGTGVYFYGYLIRPN